jgi:gamma-tubulin complex component 5
MCLHFREYFVVFTGDITLDAPMNRSIMRASHRHRSRRFQRQKRNVVGFFSPPEVTGALDSSDTNSDEDEDEFEERGYSEPSISFASSTMSSSAEDAFQSVDKMGGELDGLVRFIRRSVTALSGSTLEAAPTFGQLSFALEDWDL